MKLSIFLFLWIFCLAIPGYNQVICTTPGTNVTLNGQVEVDAFQSTLMPAGCTVFPGSITITGGVNNVDALSFLTEVRGSFELADNNLTDVDGLSSLTRVGRNFDLSRNNLMNVDGLSSLTEVERGFELSDNPNLTNVDGLSSLTEVGNSFNLARNNLTNVDGLSSLTRVGARFGLAENNLTNVDGLRSLTEVGENLDFENNNLTNVDGLSSLISVGAILQLGGNNLMNIDGLSSLTQVGQLFSVGGNPTLSRCCGAFPLLSSGGLMGPFIGSGNTGCDSEAEIINGGPCSSAIELSGNASPIPCGSAVIFDTNGTDFGSTPINTPITQTFSIFNSEDDLLFIGGATSTNAAFTINHLPSFVQGNSTVTFTVTFESANLGAQTSTIQLSNNSQLNSPICDFAVQAEAAGPLIPTMSEWALFLFGLTLLSWFANLIALMQGVQGNGAICLTRVAFYPAQYRKVLPKAAGLSLLGLLIIPLIWGTLLPIDFIGVALSVLLVAYVWHLPTGGKCL